MKKYEALMASMAGGSAGATAAPKSDKKVKVDVKAKLENLTLGRLPPQLWPRGASVDELATEGLRLKALSLHNN